MVKIAELLEWNQILYFANVVDDTLLIYYNRCQNLDFDDVQTRFINDLRKSPYRNYINRPVPAGENVVYFMLFYPSKDYPGYSYIKIFNKYASKENMIELLKRRVKPEKVIAFGTIPGKYDYVVQEGNTNEVVHKMKKLFENMK